MISFTLLSLPPETLQRMRSHEARDETHPRRWEGLGALAVAAAITVAATVIAFMTR